MSPPPRALVPLAALVVTSIRAMSAQAPSTPALRFNGDFRVRYEHTTEGNGAPALGREVVRFRIGLSYALREDVTVRARLATGAPGDPNSTDVTLSQFVDDLVMSLDLASVELNRRRWGAFGGKFTNPFQSTELVWDGDVNPQGVGGRLTAGTRDKVLGTLTALYFIVDQVPNDSSSDMGGGQVTVGVAAGKQWRVTAAGGYYDYRIRSLAAADNGDIRGNRLDATGTAYLSDYDLINTLLTIEYAGFGERFPVRAIGDYVHNAGADDRNTGWAADLFVGRAQRPKDMRFRYGYALAEQDAILAAFAHDNTTLGTNSETHTLSADVIPIGGLTLTATWYLYRPHEVAAGGPGEYQNRLRLNAMVTF